MSCLLALRPFDYDHLKRAFESQVLDFDTMQESNELQDGLSTGSCLIIFEDSIVGVAGINKLNKDEVS